MRRGNARSFRAVRSRAPWAVFRAMYQYAPSIPGCRPPVDASPALMYPGSHHFNQGGTMNRTPLLLAATAFCALPALLAAQAHEMTPEQKAEMEDRKSVV